MDSLYVGIDIGKTGHVACLLSVPLLTRVKRVTSCPTLSFEQSRVGFTLLHATLTTYAPLADCRVLIEHTGHYGAPLVEYLQSLNVAVYVVHPKREKKTRNKSDKRDALALAVLLYNQLERNVLSSEPSEQARLLLNATATVQRLRPLVQHRDELTRETTRCKNKLRAIVDELMPELCQLFRDVNCATALALREQFETPEAIAAAGMSELLATRKGRTPSRLAFQEVQVHMRDSIGVKNQDRRASLLLEQKHLIAELRLLQEQLEAIEARIETEMQTSREGRILLSFPGVGMKAAATILAFIGNIDRFESPSKLQGYCGWSPHQSQTGISKDSMTLTKGGHPLLKKTFYLVALNAVKNDTAWRELYQRLVPTRARWNARKKKWVGRMKVIGRVIGQMIRLIYLLLKRDAALVAGTAQGEDLPEPVLYDRSKHHITAHATPTSR